MDKIEFVRSVIGNFESKHKERSIQFGGGGPINMLLSKSWWINEWNSLKLLFQNILNATGFIGFTTWVQIDRLPNKIYKI